MKDFKLFGDNSKPFKTLSEKEIEDLLAENTKEAKDKLFEGSLGLVSFVLNKYFFRKSEEEKEELFQVGSLALWKTILNFDSKYNTKFSTYVVPTILGEIKRYLRDDHLIKRSRQEVDNNIKIKNLIEEYKKSHSGGDLDSKTISKLLLMPVEEVENIMQVHNNLISIDEEVNFTSKNDQVPLSYFIEDGNNDFKYNETINIIKQELEKLDERNKKIICLYFGLNCNKKKQREIANEVGVSQAQIYRIIANFKDNLAKELGYDPRTNTIKSKKKNVKKKLGSIYEELNIYDKQKIDKYLDKLEEEKKNLILMYFDNKLSSKASNTAKAKARAAYKELVYNLALDYVREGEINMNKENNEEIKTKGIYKRFNEFTAIDINEAFSALPEKYQSIVLKYYGKNLDSDPKRGLLTTEEQIILNKAIMFLNRRLTNKTNFYTRFAGTAQEEIDKILHDSFNEKEINILKKFHNGDLSRPRLNGSLTNEETKQYKAIIRKLDNYFKQMQEIKPRLKTIKKSESETERIKPAMVVKEDKTDAFLSVHTDSEEEKELTTKAEIIKQQIQVEEAVVQVEKSTQEAEAPVEIPVEETKEEIFEEPVVKELLPVKEVVQETTVTKISNEDYTDILQYLNNPMFRKMTKNLPEKEFVIISLLFGCANGKYFSVDSISKFLDIKEIDILNTAKKALIEYKEEVSKMLDSAIELFDNKNYVREKKPEENN